MTDRSRERFLQHRSARVDILVVFAVVLSLAAAVLLLNFCLLTDANRGDTSHADISRLRDVVGIVQSFVTACIIVAGGILAYRKLLIFRDFEPHLTITHSASHRHIGTQYVHIEVTATLLNSSKVQVEIRKGFFRLMQIAPIDDADVEALYAQMLTGKKGKDIQWPSLDEFPRVWKRNELVIEPGESHQETCEFIVSEETTSVLVYSYFYNLRFSETSQSAQGWAATTVYDML